MAVKRMGAAQQRNNTCRQASDDVDRLPVDRPPTRETNSNPMGTYREDKTASAGLCSGSPRLGCPPDNYWRPLLEALKCALMYVTSLIRQIPSHTVKTDLSEFVAIQKV